jgi:hypothetical protein
VTVKPRMTIFKFEQEHLIQQSVIHLATRNTTTVLNDMFTALISVKLKVLFEPRPSLITLHGLPL